MAHPYHLSEAVIVRSSLSVLLRVHTLCYSGFSKERAPVFILAFLFNIVFSVLLHSFLVFVFLFYIFIFRERGRKGERERSINVWFSLANPTLET